MIYEEIFRALHEENIRYLIVGGMAVNLYGYARLTVDLDIMVDLDEENLTRFVQIMDRLNYRPRVPVKSSDFTAGQKREEWIREKGAVVFTFIHPDDPVKHLDVFLKNPIDFHNAYKNRFILNIKDIPINLASIDDIIEMKKLADRPRDKEDIHHLTIIKEFRRRKPDGT